MAGDKHKTNYNYGLKTGLGLVLFGGSLVKEIAVFWPHPGNRKSINFITP